jgi:DNA-binding NarL/FixJ family response regulator
MRTPHVQLDDRHRVLVDDRHSVLVIDSKKLRQAGIMHLLEAWADGMGLTVDALAPDTPLRKCATTANCEMVILDVCGDSLEGAQQQALIKSVRTLLPKASLIIISDREDLEEVCSAFRAGAAGFMPTSIDPLVALQALSFIKSGGSFFPPSALEHVCSTTPQVGVNGSHRLDWQSHELVGFPPKLSAKQEDVFKLLRQGLSNKAIARQLGISEATVKVHVRSVMRKFGVKNRTQVAITTVNESTSTTAASASGGK